MADDREEFERWKAEREKQQVFGILDEWAEKSGLSKFLQTITAEDDDDDGDSLEAAAKKAAAGEKPKSPKKTEEEKEPVAEVTSLASRLFGKTA